MTMRASVVVPAYNAEACLSRAVMSVLQQTISDFEIIIIDDGSTDNTISVATELAVRDSRIRLFSNGTNKGVSASRNRGIREAKGDWIALLDSDDAYAPDRLERLLKIGDAADADMVADNLLLYDWVADENIGSALNDRHQENLIVTTSHFVENCITGFSPFDYGQLKPMFRVNFVKHNNMRYVEELRHGEDFLFYMHALLAGGKLVLTKDVLYIFTQRFGTISRTSSSLSRTLASLDEMRESTLGLMQHPGIVSDPALGSLLKRRARAILWFKSWERVYGYVRQRNVRQVVLLSVMDWRVLPLLAWHTFQRVRRGITVARMRKL